MAIKNYTSKIPTIKSLAEIQADLAIHGARKIMIEYDNNGKASGITFCIEVNGTLAGFYLTANVAGVLSVFKEQHIKEDREQAERTAWRNVRDWVLAQMSFVECGNATIEEVFLPYLTDGKQTLFQAYTTGVMQLPEYRG